MIRIGCLVVAAGLAAGAAVARDAGGTLEPIGSHYASKGLIGKNGKAAVDVSGIACLPAMSGRRRCVIVDDDSRGAQFVEIDGRAIVPGGGIPLIGEEPSRDTLGAAPSRRDCSAGAGDFDTLDGEAVAYAAPHIYVVGSHGCSRGGQQFKLSSFILARFRVNDRGERVGSGLTDVETTYRLSDALESADIVGPHFAQDLETDTRSNGLNVEGLAIIDGRLFAGLRAPSLGGFAYIIEARVADLFAAGRDRLKAKAITIPVAVGDDVGIRDLAVLSDKRLLVLTGPARDRGATYGLLAIEPKPGGRIEALGTLATLTGKGKGGKAEAVAPLGGGRILVLFDSLKNGRPREYEIGVE